MTWDMHEWTNEWMHYFIHKSVQEAFSILTILDQLHVAHAQFVFKYFLALDWKYFQPTFYLKLDAFVVLNATI